MRPSRMSISVTVGMSLLLLVPAVSALAVAGHLDRTFGNGTGKVLTPWLNLGPEPRHDIAIQPDGRIVVAGSTRYHPDNYGFEVARYMSDGTLDLSFSGDGVVVTHFASPGCAAADSLALQSDGKIVVVGYRGCGRNERFGLARYLPNGHIDTTFGGDGKVTTSFRKGDCDVASGVAVQADGRIVAVGQAGCATPWAWAVARYLPNGHLDTSFSGDGRIRTDFSPTLDIARGVLIQPDARIVVVGQSGMVENGNGRFALARYMPNGTLDSTFSGDGKVQTRFDDPCSQAEGFAAALQGDGDIVAAGDVGCGLPEFGLVRYTPNGHLDTSFGVNGKVHTKPSDKTGQDCVGQAEGRDLALQSDGKIVVVGSAGCSNQITWAINRYNTDGSLDPTFANGGRLNSPVYGCSDCFGEAESVAVQPSDGRIVVTGFSSGADGTAVVRYLAA
jgi:uncharacterized delta-60 repeat protein